MGKGTYQTAMGIGGTTIPFGALSHAFHKSVKRLLAAFFERLRNGLRTLLIRSEFEKTGNKMIQCHLAMLSRAMLKD
jgi:hypothetical protein